MVKAAADNPKIAARVKLFSYRVPEEFYDFESDPDARHNLIDDPKYRPQLDEMRAALREWMVRTKDPALEAFDHRDDPEAVAKFMEKQDAEAARNRPKRKKGMKAKKAKKAKGTDDNSAHKRPADASRAMRAGGESEHDA